MLKNVCVLETPGSPARSQRRRRMRRRRDLAIARHLSAKGRGL